MHARRQSKTPKIEKTIMRFDLPGWLGSLQVIMWNFLRISDAELPSETYTLWCRWHTFSLCFARGTWNVQPYDLMEDKRKQENLGAKERKKKKIFKEKNKRKKGRD